MANADGLLRRVSHTAVAVYCLILMFCNSQANDSTGVEALQKVQVVHKVYVLCQTYCSRRRSESARLQRSQIIALASSLAQSHRVVTVY